MSPSELGVLAGLALADSTSIGTLIIPVWLLMGTRVKIRQALLYLIVVAGFYWIVSLALLASLTRVTSAARSIHLNDAWFWVQLAIGAVVLAIGIWIDRRPGTGGQPSRRTQRWRGRALRLDNDRAVIGLALAAGLMELATMVPLLTALGMLERSGLSPIASALGVTGYVALMMFPAGALLAARAALGARITKPLAALGRRLEQSAHVIAATAFIAVGGLISADAAMRLGLIS